MSPQTLRGGLAILAICLGITSFTNAQNNVATANSKERQLLNERRETLQLRLDTIAEYHKRGVVDTAVVIAAETDLLDAELELANEPADRIAIRERVVASMKQIEEWTRRRIDHGNALSQDLLLAKAERLQAEIELLRERESRQ